MYPRIVYKRIPAFGRVFSPSPKRLVHNYKVYFPHEPNSISVDRDRTPMQQPYTYGHNSLPPQNFAHESHWQDEPRWVKWTTYTASLMTVGIFWNFYKYREPTYYNERMQLSFLSDDDVEDCVYSQFEKMMDLLGIADYFTRPFTVREKHPNYAYIKEVFDKLVRAGGLEVMEPRLEVYLMRSNNFAESKMKIHPYVIVVNQQEVKATKTIGGVASMLAPRIARKALNHQSELLNHFVFLCLATAPAVLFGAVAIRSRAARAVAVPYLWYYGALIAFQNTLLKSRQLNEADYVGLIIMWRAGYDISEAIRYRKRQVKLGEKSLAGSRISYEETPFNSLRMKDTVQEKLGLMPLQRWIARQRIHVENIERFVPLVKAKLAGEMIHRSEEEEPGADGEGESEDDTQSEKNEEVKQIK